MSDASPEMTDATGFTLSTDSQNAAAAPAEPWTSLDGTRQEIDFEPMMFPNETTPGPTPVCMGVTQMGDDVGGRVCVLLRV